ncbi:hypothetical protein [uncultured Tateyamaria sp.]|uniref:alpha/beta fold hydrolase n=1 Tax=uncultured Tateyamaria sp. TaxID=455651 RepID=UPI0026280D0A|nr:hypothetical protein [uncultured Tateyamaria sp.]
MATDMLFAPNGLAYRLDGPYDGDWIVLFNSSGTDHRMRDDVVPYLTQAGYRVRRYDMCGQGLTALAVSCIPMGDLTHDIGDRLEHLGIGRAHCLVCHLAG